MAWWKPAWTLLDSTLHAWSQTAKSIVAKIRLARNLVAVVIVLIYACVAAAIYWPQYDRYLLGAAIVLSSITMWVWFFIIAAPLRAKSVVRLIDEGYPANARELGIRMAARKLHEESIETEDLLVKTAWNEGRKAYDMYKARAEAVKADLERQDSDDEPPSKP